MPSVLASSIQVKENRQRREFDTQAIDDLASSIQNLGLLHPIVCRLENGLPTLVAGERRLRAMQSLIELDVPIRYDETAYLAGTVPVSFISDLTETQVYEAELEENILRVDLTWQERAAATAALHRLRSAQAAEAGKVQTVSQTALEIVGTSANANDRQNVTADILIASNLTDPEVAKAATKKEALKIIEKKARVEHRAKLAEKFDTNTTKHTLILADSLEWIASCEPNTFDCLLTDPPYGIDASNFGDNFKTTHEYTDDFAYFLRLAETLAKQAFRVLKPNTHAYVFCSFEGFTVLQKHFEHAGFKVWPQPLIWAKGTGNAPWVSNGHQKTYECILFASKGTRAMNTVKSDVLFYSGVANREHGAEKPVPLLADLLGRSTNPGDIVLDPFAGSGSIFHACDIAKCTAFGIERSQDYYNLALTRLTTEPDLLEGF